MCLYVYLEISRSVLICIELHISRNTEFELKVGQMKNISSDISFYI